MRRCWWISIFSLVGLSIFLVAENYHSQSFQSCIASERTYHSTNNPNKERFIIGRAIGPQIVCTINFTNAHAGFITALAGIAVAAFTLTLKWSTDRLWGAGERQLKALRQSVFVSIAGAKAAKKSADIAEKTLYISQRAYVSPRAKWSIEINPSETSIVGIGFWMSLENQGSTPAAHMFNQSVARLLVKSDGISFDYGSSLSPYVTGVPAAIGLRSEITTDKQIFSAAQIKAVADKTADLFLCGWVEYNDVFEGTPRHGVEWCLKVCIEGNLKPGECQARFDIHDQHNRYYDCPPETARSDI